MHLFVRALVVLNLFMKWDIMINNRRIITITINEEIKGTYEVVSCFSSVYSDRNSTAMRLPSTALSNTFNQNSQNGLNSS